MLVSVQFKDYYKVYTYQVLDHPDIKIGKRYYIKCIDGSTYDNPVTIVKTTAGKDSKFKTISQFIPVEEKRPVSPIKNIIFNEKKGVTVVFWKDGEKTILHNQDNFFDKEKAIGLAFMKKIYQNRGCFNEELKYWTSGKGQIDYENERRKKKG